MRELALASPRILDGIGSVIQACADIFASLRVNAQSALLALMPVGILDLLSCQVQSHPERRGGREELACPAGVQALPIRRRSTTGVFQRT